MTKVLLNSSSATRRGNLAECVFIMALAGIAVFDPSAGAAEHPSAPAAAVMTARDAGAELILTWQGDETIAVTVNKAQGVYRAPIRVTVDERDIAFDGFYVHLNKVQEGYTAETTSCLLAGAQPGTRAVDAIVVKHTLRHPALKAPAILTFRLWMEPQIGENLDTGLTCRTCQTCQTCQLRMNRPRRPHSRR